MYPTTNVDHNKLNDSDYMSHIANYLKINLTENSPRTIDDWFTYEPTEIQKKRETKGKSNPVVTPAGTRSKEVVETPDGPVSVSNAGTVTTENGEELTAAEEEAILNAVPKG